MYPSDARSHPQVLNDANIDEAAKAITYAGLAHSGQVCMSTERVIVQRGASQALISAVSALYQGLKAGDTADPSVKLSALFSDGSAENVLSMIREATESGADLVIGDLQRKGSVVNPHLVTGVKPGMRLWDRESFGPGQLNGLWCLE
jgi:acyl-CoA reductase-like NAD-dependent aldehyde dehydrogenase